MERSINSTSKQSDSKQMYRDRLNPAEKLCYDTKLKLVDGRDPYELIPKEMSQDVGLLPDLSYADIVNYLVFTPSMYTAEDLKSYKSLEAYNQFVSGWVSGVSTVVINGKHMVKARVMHSQRLREKALTSWIIAENSGIVLASHCDCVASIGETCIHVAALLFNIELEIQGLLPKTQHTGLCHLQ